MGEPISLHLFTQQMSPLYVPENILVTGGAGFIASHVVELLCRKYPQYRVRL